MKKIILALIVFYQTISFAQNEENRTVVVEIDGREQSFVLNKPSKISIADREYPITIKMNPFSVFNQAHLRFNYPSNYHVSHEKINFLAKSWNIEGNDSLIMVHDYSVLMSEEDFLKTLTDEFKTMKADVKESTSELQTKKTVLKGRKLQIKLGNFSLHQEIFLIPRETKMSILIIQDMLSKDGKHSNEYNNLRKTLEQTLLVESN